MKHKGFIDIDAPRDKVASFFANPEYLKEYQDGFLRKDPIKGEQGATGSIAKIYYKQGNGEMELTETITSNQLPESFEAWYHHIHMDNTMKCKFIELYDNKTRYEFEYEYTRINWVMPRLMSILFPGMFTKPAEKWLRQFKAFVEGND